MDKHIDLEYPRSRDCKGIQIDLLDVRASDGIRVSYDFNRDGWLIQQIKCEELHGEEEWVEAAFLPSWQFWAEGTLDWDT